MPRLRILGVDPGTGLTGFGVIDVEGGRATHVTHGVIRTAAGEPLPSRLASLAADIRELLTTSRPDEAAVEELFFAKNVTTAIAVAQARGVILEALGTAGLVVAEYTPMEVKEAVGGHGLARKGSVQEMVRRLLTLEKRPSPDDAADGLAVALTHMRRRTFPRARAPKLRLLPRRRA